MLDIKRIRTDFGTVVRKIGDTWGRRYALCLNEMKEIDA